MSTLFPGALDNSGSLPNPSASAVTLGHAALHDTVNAAIIATETKVGSGASTPASGSVLRATGTGTSAWGQVNASTDIATFASSVLRGLLTDETGTGAAVFGTAPTISNPTIITPAIASFANAQHNHSNAAGGGLLNSTAIDWSPAGGVWWEELGRVVLGSNGNTLSITGLTPTSYLYVLAEIYAPVGAIDIWCQFNGDTGNNYAYTGFYAGNTYTTTTSINRLAINASGQAADKFFAFGIMNVAAKYKMVNGQTVETGNGGASVAPNFATYAGKWANETDQITRIDFINLAAGNIGAGSNIIVLGHN